jgi:hypothetical protein
MEKLANDLIATGKYNRITKTTTVDKIIQMHYDALNAIGDRNKHDGTRLNKNKRAYSAASDANGVYLDEYVSISIVGKATLTIRTTGELDDSLPEAERHSLTNHVVEKRIQARR